jgi:putative aminopeptidase FrvX
MRQESRDFFMRLLDAAGPSGDERAAARVWRDYASGFAAVETDALGSSWASVNPGGERTLAVMGHIDEIGLAVTHVDDDGYLWFDGVGGWTPSVLVGQRIRVLAKDGPVVGVIGKKATHLLDEEERKKPIKLDQLWIDIGATGGDDARSRVRAGDLAVIEQPVVELANGRLASRAVDNRAGAFVAAEAARHYAESPGSWRYVGVASVAEEISFAGAQTSAFALAPDAAIAIDVTHTADYPSVTKNRIGDIRIGGGPVIERGSGVHPAFAELVVEVAEAEGIPHQFGASSGHTWTDADAVHRSRGGVPTCLVSVPNRYMHSPNEIVELADLEAIARLVAAVARELDAVPASA